MSAGRARSAGVALVRLGPLCFGVPAHLVRFAVPETDGMALLPRRRGALRGVLTHRGQPLPLVDLPRWLPWPGLSAPPPPLPLRAMVAEPTEATLAPPPPPPREELLVLAAGGRQIAIAVHEVLGLRRVEAEDGERLHRDVDPEELFHTVVRLRGQGADAPGPVVGLLDVARLIDLAQAWSDETPGAASAGDGEGGAHGEAPTPSTRPGIRAVPRRDTWAMLDLGPLWMGLPAACMLALVPMPPLQRPFATRGGALLGIARWRELDLAVMRPLASLWQDDDPAPLMAVFAVQGRTLAVGVQAPRGLRVLEAQDCRPAEAVGLGHVAELEAVVELDAARRLMLVSPRALMMQAPHLPGLAGAGAAPARPRPSGAAAHRLAGTHLVVDAGQPWALPLSQVREALRLAQAGLHDGDPPADPATPRMMPTRDGLLPVWSLAERMGQVAPPAQADDPVLVVEHAGRRAALHVQRLVQLVPAQGAEYTELRRHGGRSLRILTTRQDGVARSFQVLDLSLLSAWLPEAPPQAREAAAAAADSALAPLGAPVGG